MGTWKICIKDEDSFKNVEHIFPTQQMDVSSIIKHYSKFAEVKRIIIFGSSVTSACNPWSDIDVYIELEGTDTLPRATAENPIDLWSNYDVDDRLLKEIMETGVVVYEK